MHLEIDRTDIRNHRIVDSQPRALQSGDVLLSIQALALTSNNISYAHGGDFNNPPANRPESVDRPYPPCPHKR